MVTALEHLENIEIPEFENSELIWSPERLKIKSKNSGNSVDFNHDDLIRLSQHLNTVIALSIRLEKEL